jgi:hypothetical protein
MTKGRQQRGKVTVNVADRTDRVFIDNYSVPRRFDVNAVLVDGVTADIRVEIADRRARARRVAVEVDRREGVVYQVLAALPLKDILGSALLPLIWRTEVQPDGKPDFRLPGANDQEYAEAWALMRRLVGYAPDPEGLEAEVVKVAR